MRKCWQRRERLISLVVQSRPPTLTVVDLGRLQLPIGTFDEGNDTDTAGLGGMGILETATKSKVAAVGGA